MRKFIDFLVALAVAVSLWLTSGAPAPAQTPVVPGSVSQPANGNSQAFTAFGASNPQAVASQAYPVGATPITGNAQGTTGAVVGTLAAAAGKTTYICGLYVDAIGGTATIGPVTLAGIVGSSMIFQGSSNATGAQGIPAQSFTPCIPASAVNTAITITTTADGTATAVDVNSWGYQQ